MGTASEWKSVALSALFWGGWMLLWDFPRRSDAHSKPGLSFLSVLGLAFASLGFGLMATFQWRAFRRPLILLSVASLVGATVLSRWARRKVSSVTEAFQPSRC